MRVTSERFLLAGGTFGVGLASKSQWLQPVPVLTVHWWPTPVSVGGLLVKENRKMSTCCWLDLISLGSWPTLYAQTTSRALPCTPVFKIEALKWVSFWRAPKFHIFSWRVGSYPRHQSNNIEMKYKIHIKFVHELYSTCFQSNVKN